jgi:2,3-bisphosphoglycerate-dependent phosphoglycerate mutase
LIRHAASSGQASDADLTSDGHAQAVALKDHLAKLGINAIFSSPYRRALSTIAPFAAHAELEVKVLDSLHERILSPTDQKDWMTHIHNSFFDMDYALPGGESLNAVRRRALNAIAQIESLSHPLAAAVTHGNFMSSIFHAIDPNFGVQGWQSLRNPDVFEVTLDGGVPTAFRRIKLTDA